MKGGGRKKMINLNWVKYTDGRWCNLSSLNLGDPHFENLNGVYVIWHMGNTYSNVIRVGQGLVKGRLDEHRNNPEILEYNHLGILVTWALVHPSYMDGVERFLSETLKPAIGSRFPDVSPIIVNLPS